MKNKYNFAARAAVLALIAAFAFSTAAFAGQVPGSIWYNGDLNHVNGLANERDSSLGFGQYAHVWDDFRVVGPSWNITGLYSNNYLNMTGIVGVEWAIRSGVSAGNGGVVVFSGTESTNFSVTFHDPGDFGFTEFTVQVFGLSGLTLPAGHYWLNVTPIGSGNGRSFTSDTSNFGQNCTNGCGDFGNAFFETNFFGTSFDFQPTGDQGQPGDFSMGVISLLDVPEPATWAMLAGGLAILGMSCQRRQSTKSPGR